MPFFSFIGMYIGKFMYICILKKTDRMTVHAQNRLITTAKRRESELCCVQGKAVEATLQRFATGGNNTL